MGQIYTRESQPFQIRSEQRFYQLKKQNDNNNIQQQDSQTFYPESIFAKNISKDTKMKIKRSSRQDIDTEDESPEEQNSGNLSSISSEETPVNIQNNEHPQLNNNDSSPIITEIKPKKHSKKSTTTRVKQNQMKLGKIFTGMLGNDIYMDNYQQNYDFFDEDAIRQQIKHYKKHRTESKKSKRIQQNIQQSVLSENSN